MTSISAFTLADSTPGDLFTLLQHSPTPFLSVARSVLRAMSTVNIVRYFFYKGMMPQDKSRLERMVALAYQTARDRKLHPRAILIRSDFHDTTTINGKTAKDPNGWHITICYKDSAQLETGSHVACHAYTQGANNWDLVASTHAGEKSDNTLRRHKKKPVWPAWDQLEEAPEIGYGHLA